MVRKYRYIFKPITLREQVASVVFLYLRRSTENQTMTTHDPYSEYSFLLEKTQRRIKQYAQKKFTEFDFGVTVDQWMVLKQLYVRSDLSQSELAEAIYKGMPTLTRIVDLLCAKGLTERIADPQDRRKYQVHLTSAGEAKVEEMKPKVGKIRKAAWQGLQPEDFEHFRSTLNKIYKNLET
ncbi:MarR family winged helix-turn-helix transcriptional regulator [Tunicatimonas pelagia]|uniref:MarR family winged helix-turn-helix transcriptional regulator n=1 Tax=Tunicatimonas pelagia TaxID=931531 RepID=UPI0026650572|nr:MarR family transcriptional regulator [Tunicatimonas pelagia]WKN42399.1 MarR family transcriptional regulator [Tunicatimonas pelagia]